MSQTRQIHYWKVLSLFILVFLVAMIVVNLAIFKRQSRIHLQNEDDKAKSQISIMAAIVTEPLLRYEFDFIEQFVVQWGRNNKKIISLKVISPHGYVLAVYERPSHAASLLHVEKNLEFNGESLLQLEMAYDLSEMEGHLADLHKGNIQQSLLIVACVTVFLSFILKFAALRPLEKEISRREEIEAKLHTINNELVETVAQQEKSEKQILKTKQEWESTVDAIPDFIALVDSENNIIRTNKAMAQAMGNTPDELVGAKCCLSTLVAGDSQGHCANDFQKNMGEPYRVELYLENLYGYFDISVNPYFDSDHQLKGAVYIARNIDDRKIAELEKDKLKSELLHAQKLESVGQLAAGIAHEINTPGQFVSSNVEFMGEAFEDAGRLFEKYNCLLQAAKKDSAYEKITGDIEDYLEEIDWEFLSEEVPVTVEQSKDGLQRIAKIVRAMKEFSHPGGKNKSPADINKIIETTVTMARNEWKYVSEVETDLEINLPLVPCFSDDIGQVFLNLLVNAAQAIGEKIGKNPEDEKGLITIKTSQQGGLVEIKFQDTGSGIPEAAAHKIFDPFFTTKEVGSGTGQGLAIAHDIITNKHGGTLTFDTEKGKGTEFVVRLPLAG